MFRLLVIMTGLLWASLLLISWSAPGDSVATDATQAQLSTPLGQQ